GWRRAPAEVPESSRPPQPSLAKESIGFTLWWDDPESIGSEEANAIRVRVQVELQADYATFSFFMDVGQHADGPVAYRAPEAKGVRRRRILTHVDRVRDISERQASSPATPLQIDSPALPEKLGAGEAQHLQEARDALYVGMWELFRSEVGVGLEQIAGRRG